MRRLRALVVFVAFALLGAACGSDTGGEAAETREASATPIETATTEATDPSAPGGGDGDDPESSTSAPETTGAPETTVPEDVDGGAPVPLTGDDSLDRLVAAMTAVEQQSYRGEIFLTMSMAADGFEFDMGSADQPFSTMAFDGTNTAMTMDLGAVMGDLMALLGSSFGGDELDFDIDDLQMQAVVTEDRMYLHAPFLALDGAQVGVQQPAWMEAAANGWVSVSLEELAADAVFAGFGEDIGQTTMADAEQFFALFDDALSAESTGVSERRGVEVEGFEVEVSVEALMALQGSSTEDLLGDDFTDMFEDFTYRFDVYVGVDDGLIHAIEVVMDESLFESIGGPGEAIPGDFAFEMAMVFELFDHGQADDSVIIPFGAVDITDELLEFGTGL